MKLTTPKLAALARGWKVRSWTWGAGIGGMGA